MDFNLTKAREKKLALIQRRNFCQLDIEELPTALIEFPSSSDVIKSIIAASIDVTELRIDWKKIEKEFGFFLESLTGDYYIVLPGLSNDQEFFYSEYPIIKSNKKIGLELFDFIKIADASFDHLAVVLTNFEHGFIIDVFAGNPQIHGTDDAVCVVKKW